MMTFETLAFIYAAGLTFASSFLALVGIGLWLLKPGYMTWGKWFSVAFCALLWPLFVPWLAAQLGRG